MRATGVASSSVVLVLMLAVVGATEQRPQSAAIAYPDGYREWAHVKSSLVAPQHPNYGDGGGFHHIYANGVALGGYRTGEFADGAIIVLIGSRCATRGEFTRRDHVDGAT